MDDEIRLQDYERRGDAPAADGAGDEGIEVDETIVCESIELGPRRASLADSFGWETVPALEDTLDTVVYEPADEESTVEAEAEIAIEAEAEAGGGQADALERLEDEQLRLAAELATLRRAAAARERELEAELRSAREVIAARETELSEQFAQIASLTLECSGLQAQLQNSRQPAAAAAAEPAQHEPARAIARLKERLEERGRAIAVAREEIAALQKQCELLTRALAERPPAAAGQHGGDLRGNLRRLYQRIRGHVSDAAHEAAFDGEPGTEVPTLAIDEPAEGSPQPRSPARSAAQAQAAAQARTDRRREALAEAKARAAGRRAGTRPAVRRYLIALDPDRETVHELSRTRVYVGRGAEADVQPTESTVSRLHGTLSLVAGRTVVEDASSTNGVYVNRRRVRRAVLKDGDTVTFGTARYQFRIGPAG